MSESELSDDHEGGCTATGVRNRADLRRVRQGHQSGSPHPAERLLRGRCHDYTRSNNEVAQIVTGRGGNPATPPTRLVTMSAVRLVSCRYWFRSWVPPYGIISGWTERRFGDPVQCQEDWTNEPYNQAKTAAAASDDVHHIIILVAN